MAGETKRFYCLRCQHRFEAEHDPKKVVERTAAGSRRLAEEVLARARAGEAAGSL